MSIAIPLSLHTCSRVNFDIGFYPNSSSLENGGNPYNYVLCSVQVSS